MIQHSTHLVEQGIVSAGLPVLYCTMAHTHRVMFTTSSMAVLTHHDETEAEKLRMYLEHSMTFNSVNVSFICQ